MKHQVQYPATSFALGADANCPAIDCGGANSVAIQAVLSFPSLPSPFQVASGTGGGFDVNDTITKVAHGMLTGQCVTVAISGGSLPAPLAAATEYFIIKLTADTFKLATSYAFAMAGTAINLTTTGTDSENVTFTPVANAGTLTVENSIDGVNFVTVTGSNQNYTSSTTSVVWDFANAPSLWYRVANNTTAGSGATMSVIAVTKWESVR